MGPPSTVGIAMEDGFKLDKKNYSLSQYKFSNWIKKITAWVNIFHPSAWCQEYMAQENFEKIWRWAVPCCFYINERFNKHNMEFYIAIDGFIIKEEAERTRAFESPNYVLRENISHARPN